MRPGSSTRTEGRDGVFAALPPPELSSGRGQMGRGADFYAWNLSRRFAPEWQGKWIDLSLRRMDAWGLNTVANWSDPSLWAAQRKPYVIMLRGWGIEGGYLGMPDVFSEEFADKVDVAAAEQCAPRKGDPWLLGYFIAKKPPVNRRALVQ